MHNSERVRMKHSQKQEAHKYTVEAERRIYTEVGRKGHCRPRKESVGKGQRARQKQQSEDRKSVLHQHPQRVSKG